MTAETTLRMRVVIRGAVQGVGFRPFVYRLATGLALDGWVLNSSQGVFIEVEGTKEQLEAFLLRLEPEKPPAAAIHSLESAFLDPVGFSSFEIRTSEETGEKTTLISPDLATCPDCLREIFDPRDRRFLYPFTNCTNCGPRYTIIEALPYDRPLTTMRHFPMCPTCRSEYEDPLDRRFHAQPNACPECGPRLELWDAEGLTIASYDEALTGAARAIREGRIVAVKGLGGFHLMVDARNDEAVLRLRERKRRDEKPLAVMYPDIDAVRLDCAVSELERRLLLSSESPIVLLTRLGKSESGYLAPSLGPGNPNLGVMLPYTPLHHLLMVELDIPVVATSGNLSDEPICTDEQEALARLGGIADLFLVHNRPIARHVDDSVVRMMMGRELVMRRARGYAPLPVHMKESMPPVLAVGAHLKNTIAATVREEVFISQHIGDLETEPAYGAFRSVIESFKKLYDFQPELVVRDLHPDYLSSRYAEESGLPVLAVQHHLAHALACLAENEVWEPALAVSWDGTGYGTDGTVWGGEFLRVEGATFERVAHLRPFRLPGGDRAVKEPRRSALGFLYEVYGESLFEEGKECESLQIQRLREAFPPTEWKLLGAMLRQGLNSPVTTSAGRLFDGVAFLAGLRPIMRFEGQAAMELEFAVENAGSEEAYPLQVSKASDGPYLLDWEPLILSLEADTIEGLSLAKIAAQFHNGVVEGIVQIAKLVGLQAVALTGGCFQNRILTERAVKRLREEGFRPYWHQRIPPNDGGISLGQAVYAGLKQKESKV